MLGHSAEVHPLSPTPPHPSPPTGLEEGKIWMYHWKVVTRNCPLRTWLSMPTPVFLAYPGSYLEAHLYTDCSSPWPAGYPQSIWDRMWKTNNLASLPLRKKFWSVFLLRRSISRGGLAGLTHEAWYSLCSSTLFTSSPNLCVRSTTLRNSTFVSFFDQR